MENKKVITLGEPMALFIAHEEGKLEDVHNFSASIAGAEFNLSLGLTRLGLTVGYMTKLGNDPFGRKILNVMKEVGIDTSMTVISEEHQTGFMLKAKTSNGDPDIFYYRKNSAASTISVEDVENIDLSKWDAIHLTGISSALSKETYNAIEYLMMQARKKHTPIFFDPNLRPQLWASKDTMIKNINELAFKTDYFLPGINEGKILTGSDNPDEIANFYLSKGVKMVIIKTGSKGACAYYEDKKISIPSFKPKEIVDTVGAGDGFAVGVISGLLKGLSLEDAVKRGNAIGAIQIMHESDNEGLPTETQLIDFMNTAEIS